jgi:methionyl-tRNA formyltransferase
LKTIFFFGGGRLLAFINEEINKKKYKKSIKQIVVLSKRHANEKIYKNLTFKKYLKIRNIKFIVLNKITKKFLNKIPKNSIGVSFGASWIFKKEFISFFRKRIYNVHGSNLPEDRGGAGISWQILMGKKTLTSTIHFLKPGIDKGEIIFQYTINASKYPLPAQRQLLYENKVKIFFMKKLNSLINLKIVGKKQNEKKSSYWPRLKTNLHGWIDWKWTANEISSFINAFDDPYEGAKTKLNNRTVYLKKCKILKSKTKFHPFQIGLIFRKDKFSISVVCKNSILVAREIFDKNKKIIKNKDLKLGDRFNTPNSLLEKALSTRIYYK